MRTLVLIGCCVFLVSACADDTPVEGGEAGAADATIVADARLDGAGEVDASAEDGAAEDAEADAMSDAMMADAEPPTGCIPGVGTTAVGSGAIRDESTCLTWTNSRQAEGMAWGAIRQACEDLSLEGFDDWRMPTTEEALTWPIGDVSPTFYDAILTAPRYVPAGTGAADVDGRFHVCAVAWYSGSAPACYWWGPANTNGTFCVRGEGAALPSIAEGCGTVCANIDTWDSVAD
jgi:hypothetical protein